MSRPVFFRFGLLGWPLAQSLSPLLHQTALAELGLAGEYRPYPIPPLPEGEQELRAMLARLRAGELHGLNVTIPHKQAVLPLLDRLTPLAQAVGAVNTIYRQGDELLGDNTDVPGFLAGLERLAGEKPIAGVALVLGAGGAARAVVYALARSGWVVSVAARRVTEAEALLEEMGLPVQIGMLDTKDLAALVTVSPPTLIVNTTPLGMAPLEAANPWPAELPFPPGAKVYDLVYLPPETALVRAARAAGCTACSGAGMLAEQAACALERWLDKPVPREAMHAALTAHLDALV